MQRNQRRKKPSLAYRICLFFIVLLASLCLAETVLRAFLPDNNGIENLHNYFRFNPKYGIEPIPYLDYQEYDKHVFTNSQAFFGPEIETEKKNKRLVFLGDSYTIGPGIERYQNFPYLITESLKEKGLDMEMITAGMGGSSPLAEYFWLKNKVMPLRPDAVVLQLYTNDARDDYYFRHSRYYARIRVYELVPDWLEKLRITQLAIKVAAKWYADREEAFYDRSAPNISTESLMESWKKISQPALDEMLNLLRKNKIGFMVVYIPSGLEFENEYQGKETEDRSFIPDLVRNWADANQVPFVDMTPRFIKYNTNRFNELYLPEERGYHLNEFASSLVAKSILESVRFNER